MKKIIFTLLMLSSVVFGGDVGNQCEDVNLLIRMMSGIEFKITKPDGYVWGLLKLERPSAIEEGTMYEYSYMTNFKYLKPDTLSLLFIGEINNTCYLTVLLTNGMSEDHKIFIEDGRLHLEEGKIFPTSMLVPIN